MLEIKNVSKSFGGIKAINDCTFSIQAGKITALIGPNGAGKTTLFNIVCGLIRADVGSICLNGADITHRSTFARSKQGISRTFQPVRLFRYLTIFDHLLMAEAKDDEKLWLNIWRSKKPNRPEYQALIENFGIDRAVETVVSELSYGQRKLLQLLMSWRKPHHLLLLDEPVAGVNKVVQAKIESHLLKLKETGETVLLIDHDMDFIRRLADQVIVLDAGQVLVEGRPDEILRNQRVLEAYLGE